GLADMRAERAGLALRVGLVIEVVRGLALRFHERLAGLEPPDEERGGFVGVDAELLRHPGDESLELRDVLLELEVNEERAVPRPRRRAGERRGRLARVARRLPLVAEADRAGPDEDVAGLGLLGPVEIAVGFRRVAWRERGARAEEAADGRLRDTVAEAEMLAATGVDAHLEPFDLQARLGGV